MDILFPKLFLQLFVENSIIHCFSKMKQGGEISISAQLIDGLCIVKVSDNGCGMTEQKINIIYSQDHDKLGIMNVDKRIKFYYGNDYGISIQSSLGEGTTVIVKFPGISSLQSNGGII